MSVWVLTSTEHKCVRRAARSLQPEKHDINIKEECNAVDEAHSSTISLNLSSSSSSSSSCTHTTYIVEMWKCQNCLSFFSFFFDGSAGLASLLCIRSAL